MKNANVRGVSGNRTVQKAVKLAVSLRELLGKLGAMGMATTGGEEQGNKTSSTLYMLTRIKQMD
jgi:hypothetical protein